MSEDLTGYVINFQLDGKDHSHRVSKERTILGRSPTCDIVVKQEKVSRRHIEISRVGDGWVVKDLKSANGTQLNGIELVDESALNHGDRIRIGDVDIEFRTVAQNRTQMHRVVLEGAEPERHNKTAVFDLASLNEISQLGSTKSAASVEGAAWAIGLFNQATEALLSSRVLDEVLDRVMDIVFEHLPVQRGVIALYDPESGLQPRVSRSADGGRNQTIRISESVAMEAIRKEQSILVGDPAMDDKFSNEESILAMKITSAMCSPMWHDGAIAGIIYVDCQDVRQVFSEEDLRLLSSFGMYAAIAVEQMRLRRKVEREERLRERLERYNSPNVVERIRNGMMTTAQQIIGDWLAEEREVTVLFSDLCGFTSTSERMEPEEVARLLNRVFDRLTSAIFLEDGTLDKFMGDGMMAFFGAPEDQEDHAHRAVRAALLMQKELDHLNAEDDAPTILMRVGVNTGRVIAGDIGSAQRRDYTVIGDSVNVASRLESSVAKPGQVVIGQTTYELVKDAFECRALGGMRLKGKEQTVEAYLVLGNRSEDV